MKMINVKLDEENAIDMLINRLVEFWNPAKEVIQLFTKMYENYVYGGGFGDMEFNPRVIVDNDYINWCKVIHKGDDDYKIVKSIYKKEGCCDVSCETIYGFIEAANEDGTVFLMRCR